jgi:flagellar motor switch protein FliN/FliY
MATEKLRSGPASPLTIDPAIFKDVRVSLRAKLGEAELSVEELLALKSGSTVKLDVKMNDLVELRLNDALVARGEIVAVDDNFGVRIVEIAQTK